MIVRCGDDDDDGVSMMVVSYSVSGHVCLVFLS